VAAISVSGPEVPGDIWVWNAVSGELHRATRSATGGLDMTTMIVPTHHDFPGGDGTMLHGLLYEPRGLPPGTRAPVVLSVHGGPTAQAVPRFNGPHQYLLARGIAVFDFNYRGSTGYGKTFARLNDRRLRENELADLRDAVAWLKRQERIDGGRVAIMGGSYGGYLVMAALTRLPDLFASGVAFVGVANWVTALEGASPQLKASDRLEYGDIDNPADREFFRKISPIAHIAHVRAPSMILHGANDPRDPVTESDQFVRAIRERGGSVEYLLFPDEGHSIRQLSNRIIAYRRIAAFLEETVGRPRPPSTGSGRD
jgi:dipeptidyl aminopeptidase/acylaminoacyl peptidase